MGEATAAANPDIPPQVLYEPLRRQLGDWERSDLFPELPNDENLLIKNLTLECRTVAANPKSQGGRFLAIVKNEMLANQAHTWNHSVLTGFLFGSVVKEYFGLPFYVGQVIGDLHDAGKIRMPNIIMTRGRLTRGKMEEMRDHPFLSFTLANKYHLPIVGRIALGHHRWGPYIYPETAYYTEQNPFIEKFQKYLAVTDKMAASMEPGRPELTPDQIMERMAIKPETFASVREVFKEDAEALDIIEFLQDKIMEGIVMPGSAKPIWPDSELQAAERFWELDTSSLN